MYQIFDFLGNKFLMGIKEEFDNQSSIFLIILISYIIFLIIIYLIFWISVVNSLYMKVL